LAKDANGKRQRAYLAVLLAPCEGFLLRHLDEKYGHVTGEARKELLSAGYAAAMHAWPKWKQGTTGKQSGRTALPCTFINAHIKGAMLSHAHDQQMVAGTAYTDSHGRAHAYLVPVGAPIADDRAADPETDAYAKEAFTAFDSGTESLLDAIEPETTAGTDDGDTFEAPAGSRQYAAASAAEDEQRHDRDHDDAVASHDDDEGIRGAEVVPAEIGNMAPGRGVTAGTVTLSTAHENAELVEASKVLALEHMHRSNARLHKVWLAVMDRVSRVAAPEFDTSEGKRLTEGIAQRAWAEVYQLALRRYLQQQGWLGTIKESVVRREFKEAQLLFAKCSGQISTAQAKQKAAQPSFVDIEQTETALLLEVEKAHREREDAEATARAQRAVAIVAAGIPSTFNPDQGRRRRIKSTPWDLAAHDGLSGEEFCRRVVREEYERWLSSDRGVIDGPSGRIKLRLNRSDREAVELWHLAWMRRTDRWEGYGAVMRRSERDADFEALGDLSGYT
jgi:hypothetical protein